MSPCKSCEKKRRRKLLERLVLLTIALAILLASALFAAQPRQIGKDIAPESILSFTYTRSSSTNPPDYVRYHFTVEDGTPAFHCQRRQGDHWPLTEADTSFSCTLSLSQTQWQTVLSCLEGGAVTRRTEQTDTGDAGPWTYLTYPGDRGVYQCFSFADFAKQTAFEGLCSQFEQAQ